MSISVYEIFIKVAAAQMARDSTMIGSKARDYNFLLLVNIWIPGSSGWKVKVKLINAR